MKNVLITGGATGIGRACAKLFAEKGYDVYITCNKTSAESIPGVTAIKCDLASVQNIKAIFNRFDRLDVLVNNAGISLIKMILKNAHNCL